MTVDNPFESLATYEQWFWVAAILLYGVGDTVTTVWGLSAGGVAEGGLLASRLLAIYGYPGLLAVKAATFVVFYVAWRLLRTPSRVAVPFALAGIGLGVTTWNLIAITFAL